MDDAHLNRQSLDDYQRRVQSIGPDATPQWGRMNPHEMMTHLARMFEITLGHVQLPDQSNVFTRTVLRWIVLDWPWPKGKVKAPDSFTPPPERDFEQEKQRVIELMREFIEVAETAPDRLHPSPILGRLSARQWCKLQGKHTDHHLRQFGV